MFDLNLRSKFLGPEFVDRNNLNKISAKCYACNV